MRETNPPAKPELLDALAKHFVDTKFDLKAVIRAITTSHTYQLSAVPNEHNAVDRQNFSRYYPKRLHAEVLLDAIDVVTGAPSSFNGLPVGTRATQLPDNAFSTYFLTVFGRPDASSACECERSSEANLAQSLHLLNSGEIQGKLTSGAGRAGKLATETARPHEARVRELQEVREAGAVEVCLAAHFCWRARACWPAVAARCIGSICRPFERNLRSYASRTNCMSSMVAE